MKLHGGDMIATNKNNVALQFYELSAFLCSRDDSQGALRFAPVCPSVCLSVCLSVRSSRFTI